MKKSLVTLNASEHLFGLGFSETLMLRNLAHKNKYLFCSMVGGSESIRDIQESRNLLVDALEFPLVESLFSIKKIFLALQKVFSDELEFISHRKVFINISTSDALLTVSSIKKLFLPSFINPSNLVFIFDRRLLCKSFFNLKSESFEVYEYEHKLNPIILEHALKLIESGFSWAISGGIQKESLSNIYSHRLMPNYIKTGLFTLPVLGSSLQDCIKETIYYQGVEANLLNLMSDSIIFKHNYLTRRRSHLIKNISELTY